jgi:phosphotransferase system enzyme I (PtsI)
MDVIKGIPVSPGVVIGPAFVFDTVVERQPHRTVPAKDVPRQVERFDVALQDAVKGLEADRDQAAEKLGPEPAKIFEFHLGLLHDRTLIDPIREHITRDSVTAEYAVWTAFRTLADKFRKMGSEVFRQKASDVMDLDHRLLSELLGASEDRLGALKGPVIIVSHEMTPAQAWALRDKPVIGVATDAGGRTSHSSIVARTLNIPVVVGLQRIRQFVDDGDELIIDGKSGVVIVNPDQHTLTQYRAMADRMAGQEQELIELVELEPVTKCGTRISLMGNIEFPHEIEAVLANGGDGVGLYRTEFLYLANQHEPSEEEHYEAYVESIRLLKGKPLTIRTLDLGADKYTQMRAEEPERNPFLGLRSIRYCLQNLPIFKRQLRAILRASAHGKIKVMFPLIATANELRQARMILSDVMEECEEEGIEFDRNMPVGIMIEVPSAALMASTLAKEVAFFSIGTNDLIQYTLAVDRGNERVANLYSGANPAVLQLVKAVVRSARRFDVDTSICGEIAGESLYTMLLIGIGLRTLSLVPSQIPQIKRVIRAVTIDQCEKLARRVGSFDSERQVINTLRDQLRKVLPEPDGGWTGS